VDAYAAEFLRLSRFAPNFVLTDECRADRFIQGLQMEIQVLLSSHELATYSGALTMARRVERAMKKDKSQSQKKAAKRPFDQMTGGAQQDFGAPPARRLQLPAPAPVCGYCQRTGHTQQECRRAKGQCLVCGSDDHVVAHCPTREQRDNDRRNPGPVGRRALPPPQQQNQVQRGPVNRKGVPLPTQQHAYNQRGAAAGRGTGPVARGAGQAYHLGAEPAGARDVTGGTMPDYSFYLFVLAY